MVPKKISSGQGQALSAIHLPVASAGGDNSRVVPLGGKTSLLTPFSSCLIMNIDFLGSHFILDSKNRCLFLAMVT